MNSGYKSSDSHEHDALSGAQQTSAQAGAPNHEDAGSVVTDQPLRIAMAAYAFLRTARLQTGADAGKPSGPLHRDLMIKFADLDDDAVDGFSEMGRILLTETSTASSSQDSQPIGASEVAPLFDSSTGAFLGYIPVESSEASSQKNPYLPMIVASVLFGLLATTGLLINEKYIQAMAVGALFLILMPLAGALGSYRTQGAKDGGLLEHIGEHIVHAILSSVIGLLSSKWLWFVFVILMGIAYAGYMSIVELPNLGVPGYGGATAPLPGSNFPGVTNPAEGAQ